MQKYTSSGPATTTWKYLALLSSGIALIPGTGSAINLWVSCKKETTIKMYIIYNGQTLFSSIILKILRKKNLTM